MVPSSISRYLPLRKPMTRGNAAAKPHIFSLSSTGRFGNAGNVVGGVSTLGPSILRPRKGRVLLAPTALLDISGPGIDVEDTFSLLDSNGPVIDAEDMFSLLDVGGG